VSAVRRISAFATVAFGSALAAVTLLADPAMDDGASTSRAPRPAWTEAQWPFPMDQWGTGKAFRCGAAECGAEVVVYLRAKIGFCNCVTGISDDAALDGMSDLALIGDVSPLGAGQEIAVGHMKGRSRAYGLRDAAGKTVISAAFNDRCDMIVATAVLRHDRVAAVRPHLIAFLNSRTVLHWAELTLGI
jgi:hypothetical protein